MKRIDFSYKPSDLIALSAIWIGLSCFSTTLGDFPLNDDWSFGLAVKNLITTRMFQPTGWTAMSLVTNVLWGAIFCLPDGFSFGALRLSTLALGLVGVLALYAFIWEISQSRPIALLAGITLAVSPLYFVLSNTFMTDVPFTAIATMSSVFFVRALKTNSKQAMLLATAFAILATLSRQLGLFLPLAFGLSYVFTRKLSVSSVLVSALPFLVCYIALQWLNEYLMVNGWMPDAYRQAAGVGFLRVLSSPSGWLTVANNCYVGLFYLGIFSLPVTLFSLDSVLDFKGNTMLAFGVVLALVSALFGRLWLSKATVMPLAGNIINRSGFGPLTLNDTYVLSLNQPAPLGYGVWVMVTIASLIGAAIIIVCAVKIVIKIYYLWKANRASPKLSVIIFVLLSCVIYLFPIFCKGFFDRYLLPGLPFTIAMTASVISRKVSSYKISCQAMGGIVLLVIGTFSILGTKEYLAWNQARWNAIKYLTEEIGVTFNDIDGGFEFNGLNNYSERYKSRHGKSWWWVDGDKYKIGFGDQPGYHIIKEFYYRKYLLNGKGNIFVLEANL